MAPCATRHRPCMCTCVPPRCLLQNYTGTRQNPPPNNGGDRRHLSRSYPPSRAFRFAATGSQRKALHSLSRQKCSQIIALSITFTQDHNCNGEGDPARHHGDCWSLDGNPSSKWKRVCRMSAEREYGYRLSQNGYGKKAMVYGSRIGTCVFLRV